MSSGHSATARISRISRRAALLGAGWSVLWPALPTLAAAPLMADKVMVVKHERRLYLLRENEPIRSYPIRLGRNPVGPKIFQYDGRTPEGEYTIDRRTALYHLALHISYPRPENLARAGKYGLPAGGGIYIHGTPGTDRRFERDWTDGCIALSNRDVDEVGALVRDGTPIEIRP